MGRWRGLLGIGAAVAVIALVLALPAARRHPPAASRGAGGPATLATVWPGARSFPIPGTFPDGATYTPVLVLDAGTSIGMIAGADGEQSDLALVPATGPPRILQAQAVADAGSLDGITASATDVYWMHTSTDADGRATTTLWTAPRAGGPARQLTADVGAPGFSGSGYDVQVVGDRLVWAGTRAGAAEQTELRSIPLAGGPVTVRVVPGAWALSAWPWLVTAPGAGDQPARLRNAETGAEKAVRVPPDKQVTCSPTWCRTIPNNAAQATETDLVRPDGSDRRVIGRATDAAIASDVALRDRFEVLMTSTHPTGRAAGSRLALYDIAKQRTVQVEAAATNAGARGDFLWWSTGDHETLTWHGLDLRTLT